MSKTSNCTSLLCDADDEYILLANETSIINVTDTPTEKVKPKITTRDKLLKGKQMTFILRKDTMNSKMKNKIEDLFWPMRLWPSHILSIILFHKINYTDRVTLAGSFFGNGLEHPSFASNIIRFYNQHYRNVQEWNVRLQKFEESFIYLRQANQPNNPQYNHIRSTYYFYSMIENCVMYFDGDLRIYGKKCKKYKI